MMTRLYSYVCALHVYVYSSTYCKDSGYTCDCYFLCSSEHFAKVQFATISITFVKATGQSNKLLRLASCVSEGEIKYIIRHNIIRRFMVDIKMLYKNYTKLEYNRRR